MPPHVCPPVPAPSPRPKNSPSVVLEHLLPPEKRTSGSRQDSGGGIAERDGNGGGGTVAVVVAVLRAMGTTISQIENAPLRLNPFVLSQTFASSEELLQKIVVHYRGQVCVVLSGKVGVGGGGWCWGG